MPGTTRPLAGRTGEDFAGPDQPSCLGRWGPRSATGAVVASSDAGSLGRRRQGLGSTAGEQIDALGVGLVRQGPAPLFSLDVEAGRIEVSEQLFPAVQGPAYRVDPVTEELLHISVAVAEVGGQEQYAARDQYPTDLLQRPGQAGGGQGLDRVGGGDRVVGCADCRRRVPPIVVAGFCFSAS